MDIDEAITSVLDHYPTDIFPPPVAGQVNKPDQYMAEGARIACKLIRRMLANES